MGGKEELGCLLALQQFAGETIIMQKCTFLETGVSSPSSCQLSEKLVLDLFPVVRLWLMWPLNTCPMSEQRLLVWVSAYSREKKWVDLTLFPLDVEDVQNEPSFQARFSQTLYLIFLISLGCP